LETTPPAATHWSLRAMAAAVGHAPSTVHRIGKAFGLQPHRTETFKRSSDPLFVEKVRDIVGLYSASRWCRPSARWCCASMMCVDEKSQIQALDRPQPLLPIRPGEVERRTHDYTRHGTLSLFAALDTATGKVIRRCFARHRGREFGAFLNTIETAVPDDLDVHIVMDNVSSHKTQAIRNWFARRPRWHVHSTPTSASSINQVERFLANLTEKQLRRGAHRSTAELEAAIKHYIKIANAEAKPFVWTKSADDILATIKRFCLTALKTVQSQAMIRKTSEIRTLARFKNAICRG
jgi:transposase